MVSDDVIKKHQGRTRRSGSGGGSTAGQRNMPGAASHRLNKAAYGGLAEPRTLSQDLRASLGRVRNRSRWEARYTGVVSGAIEKHVAHMVGTHGPVLRVTTPSMTTSDRDKAYCKALEELWREWCGYCDFNNQQAMPDILASSVRGRWTDGENFHLQTTDNQAATPLKSRLQSIAPERVATPYGIGTFDDKIFMGIEHDTYGRVIKYHVSDDIMGSGYIQSSTARDALFMIHLFQPIEVGQVRGLPLLNPSLVTIADIRQYSQLVMHAASAAAGFSMIMYDDRDLGDEDLSNNGIVDDVELEPGMAMGIQQGYKPYQLKAEQPVKNFVEFRQEALKEIGLPVSMPGMMILSDASDHNYSSARFDAQMYIRSNQFYQGYLERAFLNRNVGMVAREGELSGQLPARPKSVKYDWIWPVMPHVDPSKEAKAEEIRLRNKTLTLRDACIQNGIDPDTHIEQLLVELEIIEKFKAAQLGDESNAENSFVDSAKALVEGVFQDLTSEIEERIGLLEDSK